METVTEHVITRYLPGFKYYLVDANDHCIASFGANSPTVKDNDLHKLATLIAETRGVKLRIVDNPNAVTK